MRFGNVGFFASQKSSSNLNTPSAQHHGAVTPFPSTIPPAAITGDNLTFLERPVFKMREEVIELFIGQSDCFADMLL